MKLLNSLSLLLLLTLSAHVHAENELPDPSPLQEENRRTPAVEPEAAILSETVFRPYTVFNLYSPSAPFRLKVTTTISGCRPSIQGQLLRVPQTQGNPQIQYYIADYRRGLIEPGCEGEAERTVDIYSDSFEIEESPGIDIVVLVPFPFELVPAD